MGKLTDRQIQAFTYPKDKGRHADGDSLFLDVRSGSLFLEVFPTGGKYWRFGFRFPKGARAKGKDEETPQIRSSTCATSTIRQAAQGYCRLCESTFGLVRSIRFLGCLPVCAVFGAFWAMYGLSLSCGPGCTQKGVPLSPLHLP